MPGLVCKAGEGEQLAASDAEIKPHLASCGQVILDAGNHRLRLRHGRSSGQGAAIATSLGRFTLV
jgi:hypothetical protein